ncbi:MAG: hypothetical protein MUF22_08135, partial [Chitinispirillaceae bacterium]|jgi:hypothetical protein|nr:hypothetical protein [Chitinispirillaceae bacterium]
MNQRFADVDTFRSHYLIVEGKSIGEVALGDTVNRLLPAFSSADDTAAFFTDSLTYLIQCRIANDTIRAMRLYKYDYDLLPSPFSTDRFLGIGSYMETVSALYTPSLLWVDRVDRGLDTVDVTVVQSKGIAFVRDRYRGTIAEVFIFKAGDSLDFSKFTYKKKFLAKQRMPSGGVRPIRVPGLFFR